MAAMGAGGRCQPCSGVPYLARQPAFSKLRKSSTRCRASRSTKRVARDDVSADDKHSRAERCGFSV